MWKALDAVSVTMKHEIRKDKESTWMSNRWVTSEFAETLKCLQAGNETLPHSMWLPVRWRSSGGSRSTSQVFSCVCVCVWVYYSNECCSYPHPCSFSLPFPKVSLWPLGESVFLGCRLEGSRLFVPRLYRKMFLAPGLSSNDVGTRNYICLDLFLRRHNYAV